MLPALKARLPVTFTLPKASMRPAPVLVMVPEKVASFCRLKTVLVGALMVVVPARSTKRRLPARPLPSEAVRNPPAVVRMMSGPVIVRVRSPVPSARRLGEAPESPVWFQLKPASDRFVLVVVKMPLRSPLNWPLITPPVQLAGLLKS